MKETRTLDPVVKENNYPFPDLIKIDAQGGELDIFKGAHECLQHATYLIVELQDVAFRDRIWEEAFLLPTSDQLLNPEEFIKSRIVPDDLSSL